MMFETNAVDRSTQRTPAHFLRFSTLRWLRWSGRIGLVCVVIGADSVTHGDALILVIGLVLASVYLYFRIKDLSHRRTGRQEARSLADSLRRRQMPAPIAAKAFEACGYSLEPGERCFLDGVDAEVVGWYGDPYLAQRRVFVAWGSPLAIGMSVFATTLFWRQNRKRQKKAAPRWRNPSPAQLWLTDRGFLLHGTKGERSWIRWPWTSIQQCWLERDGIALILTDNSPPVKLRFAEASWAYVLSRFSATGQVVEPATR